MAVDATALAIHLDRLFGRLVEHRFASDTDVTDIGAPEGVNVILTGSPREHRIHAARVHIHPPLPVADLDAVVERRIDVADGSSRLLLAVDAPYVGALGPSRVTVGLPTADLDSGEAIAQLAVMFPDQYTAPTGVVIGMSVSDDWEARVDLASVLAPDSTLRRLHDLLGGHDDVTGIIWCDDAADMFGTHRRGDTRFGMSPHFLPIISIGVDFAVLGLLWDRPETGQLDDTTLYLVSPGGNYRLESKVSLKGWIARYVRDELERAEGDRADRLTEVLALVGKRTKSADLGFGGGVERAKPRDLDADEQWVPFLYGGDGVRAPAASFGEDRLRLCNSAWVALEAARRASAAGLAGDALHAIGSGLLQAVAQGDGAAVQALYHAMIEPFTALGRGALADRCRALTTTLVPILNEQTVPEPRPPLWSVPVPGERVAFDAEGLQDQSEPLQVPYAGGTVAVDVARFAPIDVDALPVRVLVDLLDSGAVAVGPDGAFASEHGKPVLGAQADDGFVLASVWEEPADTRLRVESIVGWSDDERRGRIVQYAPLQLALDPFGSGSTDSPLWFGDTAALTAGDWPHETSVDELRQAGPCASPEALRRDVLSSDAFLNGLVLSERAAAVVGVGLDHQLLQIDIDGELHDMRYLPTPATAAIDWERSTFAVVTGLWSPTIDERLSGPLDLAGFQALHAELAAQAGPRRSVRPNVTVLLDAPPVMRLLGPGLLIRSDLRDAVDRAGLVGFDMGKRSDFYVMVA